MRDSRARRTRPAITAWIDRVGRGGAATAEEQRLGHGGTRPLLEIEPDSAPGGGIERHLAILEPLALPDVNAAGPVMQPEVGKAERRHLADSQSGLDHELGQRIVAPGMPMAGGAGGAKQPMDLGIQQTSRLEPARLTDAPEVTGDISPHRPRPLGPAAQAAQGFEPAVDRGRTLARSDQRLAIGRQVELAQPVDHDGLLRGRLVPSQKMPQVVAVAAHRGGRQIGAPEVVDEAA